MPEKKRPEKIRMSVGLSKRTTEVLAANGRTVEPFIKVFNYSGENIATSALGELLGVFEVMDPSEDSAYIVNFLSSVAKKEYFGNPRRGAIESLEAALHKINLALAELVKHGNISWLGKLHGTLAVTEKNNIHFSVTGEARILLLRGGGCSEISANLASPEAAAHPLKTFAEISSGRLLANDKIILASPGLFSLLEIADIEKHALRMDNERFAQFLRTALVNELDRAGLIILDIGEETTPLPVVPQKKARVASETIHNVFSQKAFRKPPRSKVPVPPEAVPESADPLVSLEYTDAKTGHIYVQGDLPAPQKSHPAFERLQLVWQDFHHRLSLFWNTQKKSLRRMNKQITLSLHTRSEESRVIGRRLIRFPRRILRQTGTGLWSWARQKHWQVLSSRPRSKNLEASAIAPSTVSFPPSRAETGRAEQPGEPIEETPHEIEQSDIPLFLREKIAALVIPRQDSTLPIERAPVPFPTPLPSRLKFKSQQKTREWLNRAKPPLKRWMRLLTRCAATFSTVLNRRDQTRHHPATPPKIGDPTPFISKNRRLAAVLAGAGLIVLILSWPYLLKWTQERQSSPVQTPLTEENPSSNQSSNNEQNTVTLPPPTVLAAQQTNAITAIILNDVIYLITAQGIVNARTQQIFDLPPASGAIRLAVPLDDLRLIMLYTDSGLLLAWSPLNSLFTPNVLKLPPNAQIKDIGTYLTYVYVLDDVSDQIYRFPRTEGGFGEASPWLKDAVAIDERARLAIHETLFLSPDGAALQAFFRGRLVKNFEAPSVPLFINDLFTRPDFMYVYALDAKNSRVLVWNQDGILRAQYISESLANARTLTVNEKTNEIFVTTSDSLLSFTISN